MENKNKKLGIKSRCFIIAEIGLNHNGDKKLARDLIDCAADAGVDAVKFQTFEILDIINPTHTTPSELKEPGGERKELLYQELKKYELPYDWHDELIEHAKESGLEFISTPCSKKAVDFLSSRISIIKIASMDLTNKPLLEEVGRQKKTVILSTGIGTLSEIEQAVKTIRKNGASDLFLMHCISNYPANPVDLNLKNITMLKQAFDLPVGFSDHSIGIVTSIAAFALGACIIEKHITLDRKTPGLDHFFALEPDELKALVQGIREVEQALGRSCRTVTGEEIPKRESFRRSLLANKNLLAGHRISTEDIEVIRPGSGINPFDISKVIGLTLQKNIAAHEPLRWEHFK